MEIVRANKNNLASVIFGKSINFPWRSQKGVVISVPFNEWLEFVREHQSLMTNRNPLNYQTMFASNNPDTYIRYFMYEVSWAQYCELSMSSNVEKDSTLIVPEFEDGIYISAMDIIMQVNKFDETQMSKCHNSLKAATRNYYSLGGFTDLDLGIINFNNFSPWNTLVFKMCMFIQSRSSNKADAEKINIDWRI